MTGREQLHFKKNEPKTKVRQNGKFYQS